MEMKVCKATEQTVEAEGRKGGYRKRSDGQDKDREVEGAYTQIFITGQRQSRNDKRRSR